MESQHRRQTCHFLKVTQLVKGKVGASLLLLGGSRSAGFYCTMLRMHFTHLSVCLSVCLPVCLSIHLSVCLLCPCPRTQNTATPYQVQVCKASSVGDTRIQSKQWPSLYLFTQSHRRHAEYDSERSVFSFTAEQPVGGKAPR